jgi:hypothetical protein
MPNRTSVSYWFHLSQLLHLETTRRSWTRNAARGLHQRKSRLTLSTAPSIAVVARTPKGPRTPGKAAPLTARRIGSKTKKSLLCERPCAVAWSPEHHLLLQALRKCGEFERRRLHQGGIRHMPPLSSRSHVRADRLSPCIQGSCHGFRGAQRSGGWLCVGAGTGVSPGPNARAAKGKRMRLSCMRAESFHSPRNSGLRISTRGLSPTPTLMDSWCITRAGIKFRARTTRRPSASSGNPVCTGFRKSRFAWKQIRRTFKCVLVANKVRNGWKAKASVPTDVKGDLLQTSLTSARRAAQANPALINVFPTPVLQPHIMNVGTVRAMSVVESKYVGLHDSKRF